MATIVLSFLVFVLAGLAMALGAILGRRPICSGCAAATRLEDGRIRCILCRNSRDRTARSRS